MTDHSVSEFLSPGLDWVDSVSCLDVATGRVLGDVHGYRFLDITWVSERYLVAAVGHLQLASDADGNRLADMMLAAVLSSIRSFAELSISPADILGRLNRHLFSLYPVRFKVPMSLGVLDTDTGELVTCHAGSESVFGHQSQGVLSDIGSDTQSVPVGSEPAAVYSDHRISCVAGDRVLIASGELKEHGAIMAQAESVGAIDGLVSTAVKDGAYPQDVMWAAWEWSPAPIEIGSELAVHFENEISEITKLHDVVRMFGNANQLDDKTQMTINLVLEELLANTISYGYEDHDTHFIYLTMSYSDGVFRGILKDDGVPFNPLEAPELDVDALLDDVSVGGLGTHFIRSLTSELDYQRVDEWNQIAFAIS